MDVTTFQWVIAAAVVLACLAFLVQAGMVMAMYRIARRLEERIVPLTENTGPILQNARQMLEENRPRVNEITIQAVEIAKTARQQAVKISALVDETSARARVRIAQVDEKFDETVAQVEQVGGAVKGAVLRPVREANAILAGLRAALGVYVHGAHRSSVDTATQDEEMFI
ncbi:MAG: hypothetical protein ACE15B_12810 [Bryobacteraceae bacterium]